jgi:hypothetical protein
MDSPATTGHSIHPQTLRQAVPACRYTLSFSIFNAVNYQIALTAPLILMARHWGGSEMYIGFLTALVPLLTTLQLYMAPRAEYIGFRHVMLMGWTVRNSWWAWSPSCPSWCGSHGSSRRWPWLCFLS